MVEKAKAQEGEKTSLRMLRLEARCWVQPQNMSEMMKVGGEGWEWNQWVRGSMRLESESMMGQTACGMSFTFSMPLGMEG